MADEKIPPLGSDFVSGQEVPVSGVYFSARHVDGTICHARLPDTRLTLSRGQVFPIHADCKKEIVWILIRYTEKMNRTP